MTKRTNLVRTLTVAALLAASLSRLYAPPPAWWAERGVTTSGVTVNDYAAVNLGQVKQIATKAYDEMQAKLPGGAGSALTTLITSWSAAPAPGIVRNDYASVNQGQLKTLAKLFYDRLAAVNYQGPPLTTGQTYPWTAATTDDNDYAAANIGQVKYLFSFDLTLFGADTDGDGLADNWEITHFGNLNQGAAGDPDGDGLTNLQEHQLGTNPNNADTDGDGLPDGWEVQYGFSPFVGNGTADPDGDGSNNLQEFQLGRNPTKGVVSDTAGTVNLRVYSPSR